MAAIGIFHDFLQMRNGNRIGAGYQNQVFDRFRKCRIRSFLREIRHRHLCSNMFVFSILLHVSGIVKPSGNDQRFRVIMVAFFAKSQFLHLSYHTLRMP